jgi:hypothetical protein
MLRDMKMGDNPLYRDRGQRRDWTLRERLLLNVVTAAIFVVLLVTGRYVGAAIFIVIWVLGQVLEYRRRRWARE